MKTKIVLMLLIAAWSTGISWAQKKEITIEATAGTLAERSTELQQMLEDVTHLTIKGTMNADDFTFLNTKTVYSFTVEEVNLSKVTIAKINIGGLEISRLPEQAFAKWDPSGLEFSKLKKVILPDGLEEIGSSAFMYATKLEEVEMPNTIWLINGQYVFYGCSALTQIKLPENVKIGGLHQYQTGLVREPNLIGMFTETKLRSFHVPANVEIITSDALPETLTSLTFAENSVLEKIENYNDGKPIEFVHIKFPESLLQINMLRNAQNLKTVEFGSKITSLSQQFVTAPVLETIILHSLTPPALDQGGSNAFENVDRSKVTLYVPQGSKAAYQAADKWKDFIIKEIGVDVAEQTIANFDDLTVTPSETITLSAKASGGEVTYSIADASIATLAGDKLTILKEGETTITAKQAGNVMYKPIEKTIKLVVMNLDWLEAPTILVNGSSAKIVGPASAITKFTKFYANDTELPLTNGVADLSTLSAGEVLLKATSADGNEVIRLKVNKQ